MVNDVRRDKHNANKYTNTHTNGAGKRTIEIGGCENRAILASPTLRDFSERFFPRTMYSGPKAWISICLEICNERRQKKPKICDLRGYEESSGSLCLSTQRENNISTAFGMNFIEWENQHHKVSGLRMVFCKNFN